MVDWDANVRRAEAAVPVERTSDGGWVVRKGDGVIALTNFEMRHLVRRVSDVQNAELRQALARARGGEGDE